MKPKWTAIQDYIEPEGFNLPSDFDAARDAYTVKGRTVLSTSGIIKCLQAAGVYPALIQIISMRLVEAAKIKMANRAKPGPKGCDNKGVPYDGAEAFARAYDDKANPWPKDTPERLEWHAAWWTANAAAYRAHVEGS